MMKKHSNITPIYKKYQIRYMSLSKDVSLPSQA